MPCTYSGSIEGDRLMLTQDLVTELTQLLCSLCKRCEKEKVKLPRRVSIWWKQHKKVDARAKI
jgi:hypothetical protein